jgi:hypothetical protein
MKRLRKILADVMLGGSLALLTFALILWWLNVASSQPFPNETVVTVRDSILNEDSIGPILMISAAVVILGVLWLGSMLGDMLAARTVRRIEERRARKGGQR